MSLTNIRSLFSVLSVLLALSFGTAAHGQFFTFDIDDFNGFSNDTGVGASGGVDFYEDTDTAVVNITNDSTVASSIVGFYILKPLEILDFTLSNFTSGDTTLANWGSVDDGFGDVLNSYLSPGSGYTYKYFGAETQNVSDGLNNYNNNWNPSATFTFSTSVLDGLNWSTIYGTAAGYPHIFVRWREVATAQGSSKGYAYFDESDRPWEPAVPEPSEVALMAMLGMGGLLYARRRFSKK